MTVYWGSHYAPDKTPLNLASPTQIQTEYLTRIAMMPDHSAIGEVSTLLAQILKTHGSKVLELALAKAIQDNSI